MAMFGTKKTKSSEGSELVLAYFEEVQRLRVSLSIVDGRGRAVPASLTSVSEDRLAVSPQGPLTVDKGASVDLFFLLDGLRFKASTKLLENKPGLVALDLPSGISLAERRKKPRARLNAREGATAIALTGLFDGVGLNGSIENISEGGLCIRVEKVMEVKTQRKMHMGANVLAVGQPLMLIKLNKLPKCGPIELAGTVAWVDASQGLLVGITFEKGKESLLGPVRSLVSSRTTAIPTSVPMKTRRSQEAPPEPEEPYQRPVARKEPEPVSETPVASAPIPEPPAPEPPPAPKPEPEPEVESSPTPPPDERSLALLRVKKRSRGILLAMPAGPERDAVAGFLSEDGYGRVLLTDTLTNLLEQVEKPGIHLIFVDGGVAELQDLALASLLRHKLADAMPPVVLAEAFVDAELVLGAQETGVAQILVKPYELDTEFQRMIEGHLGLG
ncbi:PilZ domain-containing protein [Geothrix sp. PMB-07]|uniref:PilZ domain-containing protein n=1 Tax=Geothrix sp. PMB-07 TaxID=3068640 RepID=UPI002741CE23|nr:PilZ domain-containing protein [Geothrix sp. PMB-07]WLT31238.1 PilZ domain-containing protein [Geothrix sp. PMB-07]